ncbi:unnamed protein product, partial [Brenthis ino]
MPKRTAEEKIEKYQRKIRKLNKRVRRIVTSSESSDESKDEHPPVVESVVSVPEDLPEIENEEAMELPTNDIQVSNFPELEPELLQALGEDNIEEPEYGESIHDDLAKRWLPIIKKGLSKDIKEKLNKEYLVPENFKLLRPPTLNTEIITALAETVKSRDKKLKTNQQQLAMGITAANKALHLLLSNGDKAEAVKHLSNCCRILLDLHALETKWRRILVTMSLDKSFQQIVQDSERDDTLFGNNLSEKIRNSKCSEKLGSQFKKTQPPKSFPTQTHTRPVTTGQGNCFRPRPSTSRGGGRGGQKRTAPPPQRQPPSSTARSSYQSTSRSRAPTRR